MGAVVHLEQQNRFDIILGQLVIDTFNFPRALYFVLSKFWTTQIQSTIARNENIKIHS